MDRLNTPGIMSAYVRKWLPFCSTALEKLEAGCVVADLGNPHTNTFPLARALAALLR